MMEKVLEVPFSRDICRSGSPFLGESWIFEEIGCGKVGVEKRYIRRPSWTRGPKHPKSP